jgi:DNA (cytosine-5)-methyltransferase 1
MMLGSLFDGISGFPLAASRCGIETKWISEIDDYCLKVSKKNFPYAKQYKDIREISFPEPVDIISGGFPCQPFSIAGKQLGKEDDRYLWEEMLRVITEVRPGWVVGENVTGIINLALDEVLSSLESQGYKAETFIIPACALNAWHRRDRVWIVAYSDSIRLQRRKEESKEGTYIKKQLQGLLQNPFWSELSMPDINGVAHGVSNRMDRIKALGNSIVPQVAYEIFKAIQQLEDVPTT